MSSGGVSEEEEILEFVNKVLKTDYKKLSEVPTERLNRVKIILEILKIAHDFTLT